MLIPSGKDTKYTINKFNVRKKQTGFLGEIYSPIFKRLFYWYTLTLFIRRFRCVWLDNTGLPFSGNSTLFIGNHNSWWDGLIPLLLNEKVFHMQARAIMDEEQLVKYPFFRRLGAFSINRKHPRKAMKSLEYAARLLNEAELKEGVGLWLYPEGRLVSRETPIRLESGLVWLSRRIDLDRSDVVPFATHMHTIRSDKPELFIKIGNPVGPSILHSGDMMVRTTRILEDLRQSCRRQSVEFDEDGVPGNGFRLLLGSKPKT